MRRSARWSRGACIVWRDWDSMPRMLLLPYQADAQLCDPDRQIAMIEVESRRFRRVVDLRGSGR